MAGSDNQKYHSHDGETLKAQVFQLLSKNPTLTPKLLCQILQIDYKTRGDYVAHIRTAWKYDVRNERGLKCSVHAWRGWTYLKNYDHDQLAAAAEKVGWVRTRARNKWLLWRDPLGRLQWFRTGRINVYVRKPATWGKVIGLISRAFGWTGLITDLNVLGAVLKGIQFKGAHYVFDTGERLPKLTIDLFKSTMGVVVKIGDKSHPTGVEILAHFPDWDERVEKKVDDYMETNRKLFQDMQLFFREFAETFKLKPPEKPGSVDYAV